MVLMFVIGCAIMIPIALIIPWFPHNASKQSNSVHTLYDVLLIVTIPIFVLVETVVLFSVWKFRMRPGEEDKDGPPIHGNTRLEVVWTAAPAVLILSLCVYAFSVLHSNEASKKGETTVNVTERQFTMEFSYPQPGGGQIVSPVLYLANHHPYVFKIRALDVIHSFFVPDFSEKLDAVPGITTTLRVTPTRLGRYVAECTELCGAGHAFMRETVRVVTPAAFQAWLSSQKPGGAPPVGSPSALEAQPGVPNQSGGGAAAPAASSSGAPSASAGAAAGKAAFTSGGCGACHTLAAAGATGTVGPDLDQRLKTDCASPASKKVRGPTLQDCIHTAIVTPYKFIPAGFHAGIMPATFGQTLSATQIQSLVTYLASVAK
jgi:cytochrome c oxidase subunit 2